MAIQRKVRVFERHRARRSVSVAIAIAAASIAGACKQSVLELGDDTRVSQPRMATRSQREAPPDLRDASADATATEPANTTATAANGRMDPDAGPAPAPRAEPRAGAGSAAPEDAGHSDAGDKQPDREPRSDAGDTAPDAGSGMDASDTVDLPMPRLPETAGSCPQFETGTVRMRGVDVKLWIGAAASGQIRPLLVYWHGTGSSASEAPMMLRDVHGEILAEGGVIAALEASTGRNADGNNPTWAAGDLEVADDIVACAARQFSIDPWRIYTAGCSFGGVQAAAMAYQRSRYVAGAMLNSGGLVAPLALEDATHVPHVITAHGASESDVVIIDFAVASVDLAKDVAANGGFAVDCDHGGGHCAATAELVAAQWQFLKAHPWGLTPSPYAGGLPAGFPEFCRIVKTATRARP